ncbi:allophanate hydrolase [Pseudomonas sp. CCI3.2]|uniref:allophanate hydrolase n=1 Tax=unclassified Pseudomonas TaxID=196821 RepID=UPI002AC94F44|nr:MULTISPECIES: allophanate hydrolase [unclassified Pseudomonas]MEB0075614.1 allophanate hydrolase [Pseudomonas sp. MH10out]MEB0099909.1 allophanate hydrolase [Pseudomonas sp. CCI3.2]MEB0132559.1 allophanate hydrolase [Pseudomonas sp. CCI2.4]MEB0158590.1 allophanate hydrolase [Pseudomonas sp. AH2 (2023)]MEB0166720.1 allophanate hydrolase [Pseudomonas sp. CCC4.4]
MTNPVQLTDLRLDNVRAAYQTATLTPRQLVLALREKAAALNPTYHLFIHLLSIAELEPYLTALEGRDLKDLPLYGVPFAIKDNIDLAGIPTTAACPAFAYTPQTSATIVEQLLALGAIPLGKTNLDQFATGLNGSRSPYGACPNSVLMDYPSGGSSAGSSLAVALGIASFALGTDTAGSGRVPAALNNLLGLKASKGLISTAGVVPACRTLDCVSTFTATAREASQLLGLIARLDPRDAYSRSNPAWNDASAFGAPRSFKFGVPRQQDLEFFGCTESPQLFHDAINHLIALGGEAVTLDLSPFLEAANLLYDGPWVAERYSVAGELMENNPEAVLPVIRAVLAKAPAVDGVQTFRAQYRLQALKALCDKALEALDCVLTPSIPRPVTRAELAAEPVLRNSELGYYTHFVNLLDYAAVAVPSGFMSNGLPWGVTLFGRVFTDQYLLSLADALQRQTGVHVIGDNPLNLAAPGTTARNDKARLVVCGAHLDGLALNGQLKQRGGRLLEVTHSSADYKLYALAGGPPFRPGMLRVEQGGVAIAVEVWELPSDELGSFLTGIPAPLGLGKVQLEDGRWETGFICEPYGLQGATDISPLGGWRAYLLAKASA